MEIGAVSSALSAVSNTSSPTSIQGVASLKMLDNAIELNEQLGQGMVQMMERSVNPNIGGNFDMSV